MKSRKMGVFFMTTVLLIGPMVWGTNAMELKFAHTVSTTDTMHLACLRFAELVKQKTGGALTITVYPSAQLGQDPQVMQAVRLGSVDFATTGVPWHTSFAPWLGVLNLPFLFRDFEHAYRVLDGEIGEGLLKQLETVGIKGLGFPELGFRNLTNSKVPVKTPQDVKGLKLRTTGDPYHVAAWKILGAIPTPMPFPEVYMALKTGTVDGQENPVTVIYAAKLYEVQKYMSLTRHAYSAWCVDMNLKKYQGLEPSHQKAIMEAMREATPYQRNLNREKEKPWLKEMKETGMIIEENPDRKAFEKIVREPVLEEYAKKFDREMIDRIQQVQ